MQWLRLAHSSVILAFILALATALRWTRRVAVVSLAVPWLCCSNALRIVSIALTAAHTDLPYKLIHEGWAPSSFWQAFPGVADWRAAHSSLPAG